MRSKTYTYTNPDGTTQTAKVLRNDAGYSDYVVGDGASATLYLPVGDSNVRANLETDADVIEAQAIEKLNRARFLRAAIELFDDEVKDAEAKRARERDEKLAVELYNAFQGPSGQHRSSFSYIMYPSDWMSVARAARKHIESEAAGE